MGPRVKQIDRRPFPGGKPFESCYFIEVEDDEASPFDFGAFIESQSQFGSEITTIGRW